MTGTPELDMADVVMLYEFRDIYDGWSVAELSDGSLVNRWEGTAYTKRYAATEEFIANLKVTD